MQGRSHHAKGGLHTQHAFTAHHAHFNARTSLYSGIQGDKALGWEIDIFCWLAGIRQHLRQRQVNMLACGKKACAIIARQKRNKVVFRGRYGDFLMLCCPSG